MKNSYSRRKFLQNSVIATAGLALSGVGLLSCGTAKNTNVSPNNSTAKKKRKIGSLEVSPIGLGCMSMAGVYNAPMPKGEMVKVIHKAVDMGVDFFDTAEVYGPFYSEEIVGEALKSFRNKVNIASKFGFDFDGNRTTGKNSKPAHIRSAVEGSLKRLQTDTIDLLYLHRMDPNTPIEDIAGTVKELIQQGKVRNFGLSEVSPETIRKTHAVQPVAALQSEYSMLERVMEKDIIPLCEELHIAFVPWGPLCRGMLTGRFNENYIPEKDYRRAGVPYFTTEALKANLKITDLAKFWAVKKNATSAQIALAWLLAQKPFIVPIPGTTNLNHLTENTGGSNIEFSDAELKEIRASLEAIPTIGFRKPESVFQDL
jgi:aryl-alcohol dehydrogenase-like predicted oxidoreductase